MITSRKINPAWFASLVLYPLVLLIIANFTIHILPIKAGAEQQQVIRLGTLNLGSAAIIYLGNDRGFFQNQGISLEVITFETAQQVAFAVASGQVDIGVAGITAALYNLAGQNKLKIIAGSIREKKGWPANVYLVSNTLWGSGIRHPSELRNISFGVTDIGSTPHYMMAMLSEKYNLNLLEGKKFVPLGSVTAMKSALTSGRIDSVVLPEYIAHQVEWMGQGHIIGYVGDETPWQITGIFASSKILKNHRLLVRRFLAASTDSAKIYRKFFIDEASNGPEDFEAEKVKAAIAIGKFIKPVLSPEEVIRYPVYIDADGELDMESIKRQIKWYQDNNMVKRGVNLQNVIDIELVKPLQKG
ncbi:ABC transporter substrate-binding protein [Endozoicomonas atrinae]|uniref:ABC transporter substrate-binding protein n=1 Tax=Endozoicomonas atrinae TaxID=1333660 RepID=UPI0009F522BC|nr:ABC transporter substrate-binding protein [Endozoicomonas atrinae]